MELKITSNRDNRTLDRKEIEFSLILDTGENKEAVKKELCKKASLDPDSTIVVRIDGRFGNRATTGLAYSYKSKEILMKQGDDYLLKRVGLIEKTDKKKAEPAKKEEAKKEDKK